MWLLASLSYSQLVSPLISETNNSICLNLFYFVFLLYSVVKGVSARPRNATEFMLATEHRGGGRKKWERKRGEGQRMGWWRSLSKMRQPAPLLCWRSTADHSGRHRDTADILQLSDGSSGCTISIGSPFVTGVLVLMVVVVISSGASLSFRTCSSSSSVQSIGLRSHQGRLAERSLKSASLWLLHEWVLFSGGSVAAAVTVLMF